MKLSSYYQPTSTRYADGISFRRAGRSGILLPAVSLGLWKNFGNAADFSVCEKIVCTAFDCGVTYFDLANNYGPPSGQAERTFGRILHRPLASHRDELFIATKAGYEMWDGPYGNWGSRKSLIASLEQSLSRLQLDYVDLFYSHRYDPDTPLEETLQALVDVVKMGKALYVGISRWPLEATRFAIDYLVAQHVPCLVYQGRQNLLDRAPQTDGIWALLQEKGVGFVAFSPLAQGLLTDRYLQGIPTDSRMNRCESLPADTLTPRLCARLVALNDVAKARGETLSQMALAWLLQRREVTSVIVGVSRIEQLLENVDADKHTSFTDEELQQIETILKDD